jgi:hypothetical protein
MSPFDLAQMRDAPESHLAKRRRRMSRRGFFLRGMSAVGLSGTSTGAYAAAIEPGRLVTTSYRLAPPGWRSGRLTVAAIADLHAGGPNMTVEHIRRARCGPTSWCCSATMSPTTGSRPSTFLPTSGRIRTPRRPVRGVGDSRQPRLAVRCRRRAPCVRQGRDPSP